MDNIERIHKITQFMAQIGVSEVETEIYLKLLELGATSVTDLAYRMKMARTTVFENTEKLVDKGLVTRTVRGRRRLLVAEEPGRVKGIVDAREMELVKYQKELESVKDGLGTFINSVFEMVPEVNKKSEVSVRLYEGKQEVKKIYMKTIEPSEVYSFANVDKFYEIFYGDDQMLWDAMEENKNRMVKDILVDTPFARKNSQRHDRYLCKFLPESESNFFSGFDLLIYGDKVAVIQLEKNNVMAVEIKSELLAKSMKGLHVIVWGLLPEV